MQNELDKHIDSMFRESFASYEVPTQINGWPMLKQKVRLANLKQFAFGHLNVFNAIISVGVVVSFVIAGIKINSKTVEAAVPIIPTQIEQQNEILIDSNNFTKPQSNHPDDIEEIVLANEESDNVLKELVVEQDEVLMNASENETITPEEIVKVDSIEVISKEVVIIRPVIKKVVVQKPQEVIHKDTVVKYERKRIFKRWRDKARN